MSRRAGHKVLHLDIMDGHFVPNLSIGIPVVEAVRRSTDLPLDVHLMISEPSRYIRAFRKAGGRSADDPRRDGRRPSSVAGGDTRPGRRAPVFR